MNIVKLQNDLRSVPDNALIGYVQNPQGQVPSYLALAELNRRKEIRDSAPAQQAQAPTQSIADQMVGEGVAALPLRDDQMFSEQAMATGGIVSFADGGDVKGFAGPQGSYVEKVKPFAGATPYSRDYSFNLPTLPSSEQLKAYLADPQAYLADPRKYAEVARSVGAPEIPGNVVPFAPNMDPKAIAEKEAALLQDRFKPAPTKDDAKPKGSGYSGIKKLSWEKLNPEEAGYDALMRPEQTAAEKMAEFRDLVGTDPNLAANKERLEKMEASTAKTEEQAPWMALARAGLGMAAGKSQFALSNIAEGGIEGIKDLAASKEKVLAAKEKQFEISSRMAAAERAEQVAAAKYGIESSEAIKARNDQTKLAKLGHKNQIELTNATQDFAAQKGNADIDLAKAKLAQDASQHAQTIAMYDKRIAATSGAAQARLVGERRKAFLDANNILAPEITRMLKDKYNGNSSDPMFQREKANLINGYVSNALSLTMDDLDARDSGSL